MHASASSPYEQRAPPQFSFHLATDTMPFRCRAFPSHVLGSFLAHRWWLYLIIAPDRPDYVLARRAFRWPACHRVIRPRPGRSHISGSRCSPMRISAHAASSSMGSLHLVLFISSSSSAGWGFIPMRSGGCRFHPEGLRPAACSLARLRLHSRMRFPVLIHRVRVSFVIHSFVTALVPCVHQFLGYHCVVPAISF